MKLSGLFDYIHCSNESRFCVGSTTVLCPIDLRKYVGSCTYIVARQDVAVDDNDMVDETVTVDNTDVLDTLTGLPVEEDTLLYAVPFCAPYSVLQNFKYVCNCLFFSTTYYYVYMFIIIFFKLSTLVV